MLPQCYQDSPSPDPAFDFYFVEAKPHALIGNRAYDSDEFDAALREQYIERSFLAGVTGKSSHVR